MKLDEAVVIGQNVSAFLLKDLLERQTLRIKHKFLITGCCLSFLFVFSRVTQIGLN